MELLIRGKNSYPKSLPVNMKSQIKAFSLLLLATIFSTGCASGLKSKLSGGFYNYSRNNVVAILPIETTGKGQNATANLFRRALYANLTHAKFQVMERYVVDALLKNEALTDPASYWDISPLRLGEILGVDAVILGKVNKVQRLYLVLHASIKVAVSAKMVDTRSGEVLWTADQSEISYEGLAKLPTGFVAAGYGPLQFVTNKVNLFRITKEIANSITALLINPQQASEDETFDHTWVTVAALDDFDDISAGRYRQIPKTQLAAFTKKAKSEEPAIVDKVTAASQGPLPDQENNISLPSAVTLDKSLKSVPMSFHILFQSQY